jgi:hypothetical protein
VHRTHLGRGIAPANGTIRVDARCCLITVFDRPLTTFDMNVQLVGRVPVNAFPLARRNDESLYDKLVVLEQQFAGNVWIVNMNRKVSIKETEFDT